MAEDKEKAEKEAAREVVRDMIHEGRAEERRAKKNGGIRVSRGVPKRQPKKRKGFGR